jgi:hypothetical protein
LPYVTLCGHALSWVQDFKYLGNWISNNLTEEVEINKKVGNFYGNVNKLYSSFKCTGVSHIVTLFNSYCCHFYGSQAWRLCDRNIDKIYKAWNKSVRHICNLPYNTHTYFLPFLVRTLYVRDILYTRSANMMNNMLNSTNSAVKFLTKYSITSHLSIIGGNWHHIKDYFMCDIENCNVKTLLTERMYMTFTPECHMLMELIQICDGDKKIDGFTMDEIQDLINDICIN